MPDRHRPTNSPNFLTYSYARAPSTPSLERDDLLWLHERACVAIPCLRHRHRRAACDTYRYTVLPAYTSRAAYLGVWAVLEVFDVAGEFCGDCG
jgi:hypothetical protein